MLTFFLQLSSGPDSSIILGFLAGIAIVFIIVFLWIKAFTNIQLKIDERFRKKRKNTKTIF